MLMYIACVVAIMPYALGSPMFELSQARLIQTKVDQGRPLDEVFTDFKRVHHKQYESTAEEKMRKGIFNSTIEHIKEHNQKYARQEKSYFLAVNQFSDLTHQEFLKLYTGHLKQRIVTNATTFLTPSNVQLPSTVDWRQKGYVTYVKNQGQCGSCWSFSATGSLEGQHFKKTGKLVPLSEQQLVDCSESYGNHGCNGGLMDQAFQYVKAVGGIESETDYPYVAEEEDRCYFKKSKERATVTGFVDVQSGSEDKLQEALATVGPISVAIDASHSSFQSYGGGVYDEPDCSSTQLDHGVLAVGYGTEPSDYWLVKNSWGKSWGMEGYVKMTRNKDNQCGIATQASYPLV